MVLTAIRGAITAEENNREAILEATRTMLTEILDVNGLTKDDLVSVVFTATSDLDAVYPAVAARELGWTNVPLLCMQEMQVAGSLRQCIRALIHCQTDKALDKVEHIYLRGARVLRPDLIRGER